jgi:hypothetical protein
MALGYGSPSPDSENLGRSLRKSPTRNDSTELINETRYQMTRGKLHCGCNTVLGCSPDQ